MTPGIAASLVPGYLSGLVLSAAGSSATFGIAAGVANDSTNSTLMSLAAAYTKTTSAWTVGSAVGALDTGTIAASTWYHVYLIERTDTGVVDVLFSLSASAPTMPASYTLKRRIGSMKTDGSSQWTAFTQTGDTFIWSTAVSSGGLAVATSRTTFTLPGIPTGIAVSATFSATLNPGVAIYLNFTSLQESDQAPGSGALNDMRSENSVNDSGAFERITNVSAQIGYRADLNSGATTLTIHSRGWRDTRGK